jgi:hypothetical protein
MMPRQYDVLVCGAGAVGGHAVEFLARRPEVRSIALVDVNAATAKGIAWRATLGALQEGKHVVIDGFGCDLLDQDATNALVSSIDPRVVFHAATLLTVPEMARGLTTETFARIREGGMAGFLSAHVVLGMKVQTALAGLGRYVPLIMASFPDFTNQVLGKLGVGPITGIGNVDNIACETQAIVAQRLGISALDVTPLIVAHHSVAEWFQRSGSAGQAPWFARVSVNGVDRSSEFDMDALMAESAMRIRGVAQEQRTAASGVKAVLAVLRDDGTFLHSAGPLGRAGGWPARLWADRLELVDVPGLDETKAEEIALAGQRKGGIAEIEADGTLVATETCAAMMRALFDIDVRSITPERIEPTARLLRAKLTEAIRSGL